MKTLVLVKIKAFGNMIKSTRERTFELWNIQKASGVSIKSVPEEPMEDEGEEEKKEPDLLAEPAVVIDIDLSAANANEEMKEE